jgi:hypothetical protein
MVGPRRIHGILLLLTNAATGVYSTPQVPAVSVRCMISGRYKACGTGYAIRGGADCMHTIEIYCVHAVNPLS